MARGIGMEEQELLVRLATGAMLVRKAGAWRDREQSAPDALVNRLVSADLARIGPDGLAITPAGGAWLARSRSARGREPGRLLVERPSAQDADGGEKPRRSVTVNLAESPLGWLMAHGRISPTQFAAGERLRADWERAGHGTRVTMRWDASPAAKGRRGASEIRDLGAAKLSARTRVDGAMAAAGSGLSDILWRVVCAGEGLEAAERNLGWPARAGKLVLTMALNRVAEFYGLDRTTSVKTA